MSNRETNNELHSLDMPTRKEGVAILMRKWQGIELTDEEIAVLNRCETMGGVATTETIQHSHSKGESVDQFSYPPVSNPLENVVVKDGDE